MLARCRTLIIAMVLAFGPAAQPPADLTISQRSGGGNEVTLAGASLKPIYAALHGVGAPMGRMDSYGWRNLARVPTVHDFDAGMMMAWENRITPIVLLEYDGSYQYLTPPQLLGSYDDWFAAGVAYALYLRPGGTWAQEHGVRGWGVTIFSAINEPDIASTIPLRGYHDALSGLANGVHSVDPELQVIPGGFATCNSAGDATLRGYGPAIADLLNDGTLDGIDLHTYYDTRWFPIAKGNEFSAQSCFDRIKAASGIKRDINFFATEFNVNKNSVSSEADAARLFLTGLWDNLGVTKQNGATPATVLAFPWNLAMTEADDGGRYAMSTRGPFWAPNARGKIYRTVLELAGSLRFSMLDPHRRGYYVLDGVGRRLVVWQDIPGWTNHPGNVWTEIMPAWAHQVQLWGYDGLRRCWLVNGGELLTVDGLPGNETYMLMIKP